MSDKWSCQVLVLKTSDCLFWAHARIWLCLLGYVKWWGFFLYLQSLSRLPVVFIMSCFNAYSWARVFSFSSTLWRSFLGQEKILLLLIPPSTHPPQKKLSLLSPKATSLIFLFLAQIPWRMTVIWSGLLSEHGGQPMNWLSTVKCLSLVQSVRPGLKLDHLFYVCAEVCSMAAVVLGGIFS